MILSVLLLGVGLVSGLVLNSIRSSATPTIPWNDPVVVSSGVLFLWLLAAALFNFLYRPARVVRKVAYLTVANFLFLARVIALVRGYGGHAPTESAGGPRPPVEESRP